MFAFVESHKIRLPFVCSHVNLVVPSFGPPRNTRQRARQDTRGSVTLGRRRSVRLERKPFHSKYGVNPLCTTHLHREPPAMGNLFSCCCESDAERLLREEEDREASLAARDSARYAATQRHATFENSAGGRAAHKAQQKMRQNLEREDRAADQRVADWNS